MSIKIADSNLGAIKVGTGAISKVYVGNTLLWENAPSTASKSVFTLEGARTYVLHVNKLDDTPMIVKLDGSTIMNISGTGVKKPSFSTSAKGCKLSIETTGQWAIDEPFLWYDGNTQITNIDFTQEKNLIRLSHNLQSTANYSAFANCSRLHTVTLPNCIKEVGGYIFNDCNNLLTAYLPGNYESMSDRIFWKCISLEEARFTGDPANMTYAAFEDCSSLKTLYIPYIGAYKHPEEHQIGGLYAQHPFGYIFDTKGSGVATTQYFLEWSSSGSEVCEITYYIPETLKTVTVADGNLPYGSFINCSNIENVILGNIGEIGDRAFENCTSLKSITIPNSITSIGDSVFNRCSGLTSIAVDSGNKIYHSAGNCLIKTASKALIYGCKNSIIPSDGSVTSIGYKAFYGCGGPASIVLSDKITSIDNSAFAYCNGIISITVEEGNRIYHSFGNCLINTTAKELILGCQNSILPKDGSVMSIGDYAFTGCSGLTSIEIPSSVISIGLEAFEDCTGLTNITIGKNVTSISHSVFKDCSSLSSITIPATVNYMGSNVFSGCMAMTDIYCEAASKPSGWDETWLGDCPATVHWGC